MKPRWLVKHNRGWCASKVDRKWDEASFSIATLCKHFVILPIGCKQGVPTCEECLKVLQPESQKA